MSFGYEHLRTRKHSEHPDVEHSDEDGNDEIELQVLIPNDTNEGHTHEVEVALANDDQGSEAESTDVEIYSKTEDKRSLINSSEDKSDPDTCSIDKDGVVREYEVALQHIGFGLFHIILVVCNGLALTSDAVEVLSISFVLPVIDRPEELDLQDWQTGLLSSVIFIGMLFGSYFWGGLADTIGRKKTLVFSLTVSGLFGLVSAFSPNYVVFILMRFFSGFGVGGSLPVLFPYISEFIRNKYRGPYLGVQSIFWMIGRLLCGAIAWAIIPNTNIDFSLGLFRFHSWRLFLAVSAIPSLLGVLLYWLLPESPRFLLEVGKEKEAIKVLKMVHKLNHWRDKQAVYPVKSIQLGSAVSGKRGKRVVDKIKLVLKRSAEMFNRKLLLRSLLLLLIMFCLSFGSYGVTLWYPTYVSEITRQRDQELFRSFCSNEVTGVNASTIPDYCGCSETILRDSVISDTRLDSWVTQETIFDNVTFERVHFARASFKNSSFVSGSSFINCTFSYTEFTDVVFDEFSFESSNLSDSRICNPVFTNLSTWNNVFVSNLSVNDINLNSSQQAMSSTSFTSLLSSSNYSCDTASWTFGCPRKVDDFSVYRDSFFISASALPGNLASAVAVYFLTRKYWLAFSLLASTLSVFLLYVVHSEAVVVVMLCLFSALSTPAWNDSGLIIAEVYPTHLRATANGIHLISARIGAIIGTNVFGEFVHINPSIPIILVVVVLFIGAIAALPLPKTTRKTLLK